VLVEVNGVVDLSVHSFGVEAQAAAVLKMKLLPSTSASRAAASTAGSGGAAAAARRQRRAQRRAQRHVHPLVSLLRQHVRTDAGAGGADEGHHNCLAVIKVARMPPACWQSWCYLLPGVVSACLH
jgi:hypothetical protein